MPYQKAAHIFPLFVFQFLIAPSEQFDTYWNVPTEVCLKNGIQIPLAKYGIRSNKYQKFYGEEVITFYEDKLGYYPFYSNTSDNSSAVNTGLPQLTDMKSHLKKAENDIIKAIPDVNFSGLAIIDFESWRPQYILNWSSKRIYQRESERIVRERQRNFTDSDVKRIAQEEFDKAAFNFMVETIRLGKRLRPNGKWGFYGFPYCNYDAGKLGEYTCSQEFQGYNDGLISILDEASALFPSIYLQGEVDQSLNHRYVQAILTETNRILPKLKDSKPVYAYSGFEYRPKTDPFAYYSKDDLCSTVKQMIDLGMQGTIVWSTSIDMKARCKQIADYISNEYGPYLKNTVDEFNNCAIKKCLGQGHCVLRHPEKMCKSKLDYSDYECRQSMLS